MTDPETKTLLDRARNEDAAAADELFRRHRARLAAGLRRKYGTSTDERRNAALPSTGWPPPTPGPAPRRRCAASSSGSACGA